jgi:hypothetical protein
LFTWQRCQWLTLCSTPASHSVDPEVEPQPGDRLSDRGFRRFHSVPLKSGHGRFLPHPLKFANHLIIRRCRGTIRELPGDWNLASSKLNPEALPFEPNWSTRAKCTHKCDFQNHKDCNWEPCVCHWLSRIVSECRSGLTEFALLICIQRPQTISNPNTVAWPYATYSINVCVLFSSRPIIYPLPHLSQLLLLPRDAPFSQTISLERDRRENIPSGWKQLWPSSQGYLCRVILRFLYISANKTINTATLHEYWITFTNDCDI